MSASDKESLNGDDICNTSLDAEMDKHKPMERAAEVRGWKDGIDRRAVVDAVARTRNAVK